MTDKQMEEKKKEFLEKFGLVGYEYNTTGIWQWIEKLVEEVEREAYNKGVGEVLDKYKKVFEETN